jgi:hypothetical protein
VTELRQIITAIDRSTIFGARVAAIILLGYASALRTGDLAALSVADLEPKPAGLFVHIHRSKTDQDATGEVVGVAHGTHSDTDRVTAINTWLQVRGTAPGPLFVRLRGGAVSDNPLAPHTLSRLLHARAEVAGLPAARITGHSLRAGHATAAYAAGVHLDRIAAQTRHKDLAVLLNRYIRPLAPWKPPPAATSACEPTTQPAQADQPRPSPKPASGQRPRLGDLSAPPAQEAARSPLRRLRPPVATSCRAAHRLVTGGIYGSPPDYRSRRGKH